MRDNAPVRNTCPTIDYIIQLMESAINEANYIMKYSEGDVYISANEVVSCLGDAVNDMENIRSDNAELREWGNDLYYEKEYLERDLDDANRKIEMLEDKVRELECEVDELKNELSER